MRKEYCIVIRIIIVIFILVLWFEYWKYGNRFSRIFFCKFWDLYWFFNFSILNFSIYMDFIGLCWEVVLLIV